jgi:endonuclease YncB( thermonuclease family)
VTLEERAVENLDHGQYWRWRASVRRVIDGDTVDCALDLGLGITLTPTPNVTLCHVRFAGYDAPEASSEEGRLAITALGKILYPDAQTVAPRVFVNSAALDKYGRILGTIDLLDGRSVIDEMVGFGWLRPYNGRGPKPW